MVIPSVPRDMVLSESLLGRRKTRGVESRKEGRERWCKPVWPLAVPGTKPDLVQKDRDMLAGKNPAVLLLPTCTLTYIRWNRVRRPATATQRPTTLKNSLLETTRDCLSTVRIYGSSTTFLSPPFPARPCDVFHAYAYHDF